MPTYQYACTNAECGNRFEQFQAFTDASIADCPQCAERVRKVYGSVGVVFKGSGFYRTDSRDAKSSAPEAKTDSSSSSSSSSDSTSSTTPAASSTKSGSPSSTPAAKPAAAAAAAAS
jgi:putative FmdB family regulatory protein